MKRDNSQDRQFCAWLCWDHPQPSRVRARRASCSRPLPFPKRSCASPITSSWRRKAASSAHGGDRRTLPAGIELAPDGTLSGTPTEVDAFEFIVTVTDSGKPAAKRKRNSSYSSWPRWWSSGAGTQGDGQPAGSAPSEYRNQTGDDFDFTLIALAVNENGRATAVGYQHFTLNKDTDEFEIPFAREPAAGSLRRCMWIAVGEVAIRRNSIFAPGWRRAEKAAGGAGTVESLRAKNKSPEVMLSPFVSASSSL